ncbi:tetratricopeptide repeat protein [Lysobacter sp. M15]|uniref:YfgM family protein n=1 Tax=Lysobacter sp. M15 TaxID=2916837 RepID=UPI001F59C14A|nr:tetratricopeptide repeat protein [Lysobacter sp. M15]
MAIDELLDEHEQGERVRSWLRSNGGGILGGILLGLAAIGGWQWWQKQQHQQRAQAGERYQSVLKSLEGGDPSKAKAQAQVSALDGTAYGTLAAMALAKSQADLGQRDAAIATLRAARNGSGSLDPVLEQRLARLLIDAGKPQEALALLANASGAGALETRGDAEFAAGKPDAARASYRKALSTTDEASPQRRLLELKLSEVGGSAADTSAKPEA